ncbi:cobalt/nickel transport system permease protein [Desulfocicer vacuolatum DSM 3385]|uniref:Cobalt/nickel transport system permease protein n=1 Tax=Desulfocicer vacuolatum DSM 3385 TaxID=1121400 RepID=A0A1W1ZCT8_9BACT|nr:cobalt transporter CbiM [Desulfocicer vacuolatum]SMC46001.1 cobalt/nickel transport system permease protein [Desulfocicer vacuolatum DSM 3385]
MHISEGVVSGPVMMAGAALAFAGTAVGLKKIDYERMVHVAILSSAFFVASLIHVNLGPSSVHLILNGIVGLLLGWAAFPAILTALLLQAILFQYGGITALGVNTVIMALPAVICYYLVGPLPGRGPRYTFVAAFLAGAGSVGLAALGLGSALYFTEKNFLEVSMLVMTANLPVMIIEGIVTGFCVTFLLKVYPEIFPRRGPEK